MTRWGRRLAAAQVALSVPLLVTAWIVAANLHRLEGVNTGFRPDGVIVASLTRQVGVVPAADPVAYLTQLASALRAGPGIAAAALTWNEPLSFGADWRRRPITGRDGLRSARSFVLQVSPGYFETLGVPLVAGRDFRGPTTAVRGTSPSSPRESPARCCLVPIRWGSASDWAGQPDRLLEVIGVVADAKLAEPQP